MYITQLVMDYLLSIQPSLASTKEATELWVKHELNPLSFMNKRDLGLTL